MQPHIVLKPLSEVYGTTVSNSAVALPSVPNNALRAYIQVYTADVNYRLDATTTVTAGDAGGMTILSATDKTIDGYDNINRMRLYRYGSSDGFIKVQYFGEGQPS